MNALAYADLDRLAGARPVADVPCPLCSSIYNPKRRVLRVWRTEPGFASFHCARCQTKGWARDDHRNRRDRPSPEHLEALRREAEARDVQERERKLRTARGLWTMRQPIRGTPAERYLREARGYRGPIPATLGYLPARGDHVHALVSAFGIPSEPEPGVLDIADEAVTGLHLTKLSPDGSSKAAEVESAKIMLGRSMGFPIAVAPPNDLLGLAVTEGIEDALSIRQAMGLGAWAAGSAGRMPALADAVPAFIDCVTIFAHPDPAGQAGAQALAEALAARGIETVIQGAAPC